MTESLPYYHNTMDDFYFQVLRLALDDAILWREYVASKSSDIDLGVERRFHLDRANFYRSVIGKKFEPKEKE